MSYQYYQQFTDDEDLFPRSHYEAEEDFDIDEPEEDQESDEDDYNCCGGRGCNSCLGVDW